MSKKTQIPDSNNSDTDRKSTGSGINKEFPAVHVIGSKDSEKHFGSSADQAEYQSETAGVPIPKADVNLQIEELIWREAEKKASGLKMEISEYVEKALEQFNRGQ